MGDQGIEVVSLSACLEQALRRPGMGWRLLLRFHASGDAVEDCSQLSQALPWLRRLERGRPVLCEDLRRHGFGIVVCSDAEEAWRLLGAVRSGRVSGVVFGRKESLVRIG